VAVMEPSSAACRVARAMPDSVGVLEGETGPSGGGRRSRRMAAAIGRPWPTTRRWRSSWGSPPRPLLSPVHGEPITIEQLMDLIERVPC